MPTVGPGKRSLPWYQRVTDHSTLHRRRGVMRSYHSAEKGAVVSRPSSTQEAPEQCREGTQPSACLLLWDWQFCQRPVALQTPGRTETCHVWGENTPGMGINMVHSNYFSLCRLTLICHNKNQVRSDQSPRVTCQTERCKCPFNSTLDISDKFTVNSRLTLDYKWEAMEVFSSGADQKSCQN